MIDSFNDNDIIQNGNKKATAGMEEIPTIKPIPEIIPIVGFLVVKKENHY